MALGVGFIRSSGIRLGTATNGVRSGVSVNASNIGDTDAHGILVELRGQSARGASAAGGGDAAVAPLTAFTFIHGLPGQGDRLAEHLLSLAAPTRAEDGAIRYDLYRSVEHPDDFLRHEVWRDRAALEAHKQTPPLKASFARRQREGWTTLITLWRPAGE